MAYKQISPVSVPEGGTAQQSFTAYAVIVAGSTSDGAFQQAQVTSMSGDVLASNGSATVPSFQSPPIPQFRFQLLSSDPGSPSNGQVWYNTTSNLFKGRANGVTRTFDAS